MSLPSFGQIGAGRVIVFPSETKHQLIALPSNLVNLEPFTFTVCGNSFTDEGIVDGTVLIARRKFRENEITDGRLCIVRIAENGDTMKRVYRLKNEMIRLSSGNKEHPDAIYAAEFVEVIALIEGEWKERF